MTPAGRWALARARELPPELVRAFRAPQVIPSPFTPGLLALADWTARPGWLPDSRLEPAPRGVDPRVHRALHWHLRVMDEYTSLAGLPLLDREWTSREWFESLLARTMGAWRALSFMRRAGIHPTVSRYLRRATRSELPAVTLAARAYALGRLLSR